MLVFKVTFRELSSFKLWPLVHWFKLMSGVKDNQVIFSEFLRWFRFSIFFYVCSTQLLSDSVGLSLSVVVFVSNLLANTCQSKRLVTKQFLLSFCWIIDGIRPAFNVRVSLALLCICSYWVQCKHPSIDRWIVCFCFYTLLDFNCFCPAAIPSPAVNSIIKYVPTVRFWK